MFIELKTKNFRKHIDRTFSFEGGVIALRGANEDGKTTMLEAIGYAMGGATMLREPLAEVVTWGQKEASLKVWLTFAINEVRYYITRSKSGAEIRDDEKILATGQTEVTRYVETLLGCSVKTATQLMLANQQKLRGTLEEDGAAVKLIEQLADFQLIDRIIALVQKHLPCGTTATVEARIGALQEQLATPLVDETAPYVSKVAELTEAMDTAGELYHVRKSAYDRLQQPAKDAQQRLDRVTAARQQADAARRGLENAKATFASIKPVPGPDEAVIAELRRQVEDASRWSRAVAAHRALQAVPEPSWEGPYSELLQARQEAAVEVTRLQQELSASQVRVARLESQMITQTACGLCGKDLSQIPEVVAKNEETRSAHEAEVVAIQPELRRQIEAARTALATFDSVVADGQKADRVFHACAEFITLDRNFTPAECKWVGPDMTQPPNNPADEYQQALTQQQAYQRELGRQQQAQTAVKVCGDAVLDADAELVDAEAAVGDAQRVLDDAAAATSALFEAESAFRTADQAVKDATRDLQMQQALHQQKVAARKVFEDQLVATNKELTEMNFNNELVNALRKARPSIVEELWNIVGATVSSTFSAIRGTPSTFLRADDSFTVDGRGIKGLSGSTLDALGLAIRMSLTKTFLPNTRFMVLDEPAAAADNDRETNMLGVIASSEFDQVLLVTHSDLADSFASQVIRL